MDAQELKRYFLSEAKMKKLAGLTEERTGSKLFSKSDLAEFPKIYSQENKKQEDIKIIAKLFIPGSRWTWYLTEFDGEDSFFGYVKSGMTPDFDELGYVSLSELEGTPGIERDKSIKGLNLSKVMATKKVL